MNNRMLQILTVGNIIAVILTIIVNSLANIIPIGGKYTGELSDNIPNLFVPAGITFSIWGVIYVLIILFVIYLGRDLFKIEKVTKSYLENISYFFILACLANIIWIFLWHYEQILLSLLAMILLFYSLLIIYLRLDIGNEKLPYKEKLFIHVPISVYLGWITVATIANVTALLVTIDWNGFGISEYIWTIFILIIVTVITIRILLKKRDFAYSFVIIWALLGIIIKRFQVDPTYGVQTGIYITAIFAIIVIIITIIINLLKREHLTL